MKLYPLKFTPIFQDKVWGGDRMAKVLGKKTDSEQLGESWEISDVEGYVSKVENGVYAGKDLRELMTLFPESLMGMEKVGEFPLLIKFLDARVPLSIQVHPDEEWARKLEHSHGKTEMWYVVEATEESEIYLGWKKEYKKEELINAYKQGNIKEYLRVYKPKKGNFFYIPAGSIHSLGKGLIVAEIQQTSDITYRIYDWGRTNRELHIDKAIEVTDYQFKDDFQLEYERKENQLNKVIESPFFSTYFLPVNGEMKLNTQGQFEVLMCVEGEGEIHYYNGKEAIKLGETFLLPADLGAYTLQGENLKILKVHV